VAVKRSDKEEEDGELQTGRCQAPFCTSDIPQRLQPQGGGKGGAGAGPDKGLPSRKRDAAPFVLMVGGGGWRGGEKVEMGRGAEEGETAH
jgi:hypothetical protein